MSNRDAWDAMMNARSAADYDAEAAANEEILAQQRGDTEGAKQARRRMARAEAQIVNLDAGLSSFDEESQPQQQQQSRQWTAQDWINHWAPSMTPWQTQTLREHPEFLSDPEKWQQLQDAVRQAHEKQLDPNSSEYKGFMYQKLGVLPKLTQQQKEHAKWSGISEEVYAENEIKRLQVEKLYQRSNQ